ERGARSVLAEGGPSLNAQLAGAGLLDEVCLTLSPAIVGGDGKRIVTGPAIDMSALLRTARCARKTATCSSGTSPTKRCNETTTDATEGFMSHLPISEYALLSDCKSAALVSKNGSVDWLCFPRFDGPSVFGRLLDERAGHWSIRPTGEADVSRRYVDD